MTQSLKTNQLIFFPIEKPSATAKLDMDVSKNRGKTPKMDGEKNGKPYKNG